MNPMEAAAAKKQQERETLRGVIAQWNANRLDLFELSEPNEVSLIEHYALQLHTGIRRASTCLNSELDEGNLPLGKVKFTL